MAPRGRKAGQTKSNKLAADELEARAQAHNSGVRAVVGVEPEFLTIHYKPVAQWLRTAKSKVTSHADLLRDKSTQAFVTGMTSSAARWIK